MVRWRNGEAERWRGGGISQVYHFTSSPLQVLQLVNSVDDYKLLIQMESTFNEQMRKRTKVFALEIIKLFQALPKNDESRILGEQLLRSGTSVAANFRAPCRSGSTKEYFAKICIVVEECDETIFWLELLGDSGICKVDTLKLFLKESEELIAIFAKTKKNIKL